MIDRAPMTVFAGVALVLVLAGSGTGASGGASSPQDDAPSRTMQWLMLPADLPEHFEIDVRLDGVFHTLVLKRHSLRASGFRVRAHLSDGSTADKVPPVPATYRGSIAGETGTSVIADLGREGLNARLVSDGRLSWTIRGLPGEDRSSPGKALIVQLSRPSETSRAFRPSLPRSAMTDVPVSPAIEPR